MPEMSSFTAFIMCGRPFMVVSLWALYSAFELLHYTVV